MWLSVVTASSVFPIAAFSFMCMVRARIVGFWPQGLKHHETCMTVCRVWPLVLKCHETWGVNHWDHFAMFGVNLLFDSVVVVQVCVF